MSLKVYNTLTNNKGDFLPLEDKKVRMYACGVTVYDECHVGHARAYVSVDIIRRYLEYRGYEVKHVQNFTDIDDKVIGKAKAYRKDLKEKEGKEITVREAVKVVAEKYTKEYFKYIDRLFVKRAHIYPKAVEHIYDMIKLVEGLIEKGYAYVVDGNVFFRVGEFPSYGKLSGRKPDDMKAGARIEIDANKQNPLDFVLWKNAKDDEPFWESPWGKGRPGWHIECSAMSMKYLGESFDIHTGGQDLIFPHHENEIAQSESYTGKQFSKYWFHNGFVTINKEKMSKSLANFVTLREILDKYGPAVVRLFLISTHYRHPVNFSQEELGAAGKKYERLKECDRKLRSRNIEIQPWEGVQSTGFVKRFEQYMDDDFNTSGALGVIFDMVRYINTQIAEGRGKRNDLEKVAAEYAGLREVLGLPLAEEVEPLEINWEDIDESERISDSELEKILSRDKGLDDDEVELLAKQKELARKSKDWLKADRIRKRIAEFRKVKDKPRGTSILPL